MKTIRQRWLLKQGSQSKYPALQSLPYGIDPCSPSYSQHAHSSATNDTGSVAAPVTISRPITLQETSGTGSRLYDAVRHAATDPTSAPNTGSISVNVEQKHDLETTNKGAGLTSEWLAIFE